MSVGVGFGVNVLEEVKVSDGVKVCDGVGVGAGEFELIGQEKPLVMK